MQNCQEKVRATLIELSGEPLIYLNRVGSAAALPFLLNYREKHYGENLQQKATKDKSSGITSEGIS